MLKLHASYSKKVPAEEKYSSHSFHASVEVELPDGMPEGELQNRIHQTFKMVRNSVENEIAKPLQNVQNQPQTPSVNAPANNQSTAASNDVASPKQIKYLLDLLNQNNTPIQNVINRFNVSSLQELSRKQCSQLIDEITK